MAKLNSLIYVKRYLLTFENVEVVECLNSTYFNIDGIKIRISNHSKKQTKVNSKYDLSVIQPVNDDKQYIVIIKSSLAMLVMDLKSVKEFIRNFIFIQKMNKFEIPLFTDDMSEKEKEKVKIDLMHEKTLSTIKDTDHIDKLSSTQLGEYLSENYRKWYNDTFLSKNCKKLIRAKLVEKDFTIKEMNKYLQTKFKEKIDEIAKSQLKADDINLIFG